MGRSVLSRLGLASGPRTTPGDGVLAALRAEADTCAAILALLGTARGVLFFLQGNADAFVWCGGRMDVTGKGTKVGKIQTVPHLGLTPYFDTPHQSIQCHLIVNIVPPPAR